MTIWRLNTGQYTTVCVPCLKGTIRDNRKATLSWAFMHVQRHQKAAIQ